MRFPAKLFSGLRGVPPVIKLHLIWLDSCSLKNTLLRFLISN